MQDPVQVQIPAPTPAPAAPAAPAGPGAYVPSTTVPNPVLGQIPLTARDVAALRARRSELSDQLISATSRRDRLARQLERTGGADRVGIQQHMAVLDQRIVQLESDIAQTGQLLASAPASAYIASAAPSPPIYIRSGGPPVVFGVLGILLFAPLVLAAAWRLMRRPHAQPAPPGWAESMQRLERLEQAVDTIAIEIERVSEGQRFTTRLLVERAQAEAAQRAAASPQSTAANGNGAPLALGPGAAEPIELPKKQRVGVARD